MTLTEIRYHALEIRLITETELNAVLDVYRQCEDFLSLGPVPTASMQMVRTDLELSRQQGGMFCGIYRLDGTLVGIVDYVPCNFEGDPHSAFLSLLLIGKAFRSRGIGSAVVAAIEAEIRKDTHIRTIFSGVQVNNPQAIQFWQKQGYRIISGPTLMPDQTTVFGLRKDFSPED